MKIDISNMGATAISKLPREQLNHLLSLQCSSVRLPDVRVIIAAQFRIIDLEYELEEVKAKLAFFQKEWENAQKPDGNVFDGKFEEVRG